MDRLHVPLSLPRQIAVPLQSGLSSRKVCMGESQCEVHDSEEASIGEAEMWEGKERKRDDMLMIEDPLLL